jgi:hypothetical protein
MTLPLEKFFQILNLVAPIVFSLIPGVPPALIPLIVDGIGVAQQSAQPGADKKAAVLASVTTAIGITAAVPGGPKMDAPLVTAAVGSGIDAVISTIHAIEGAHAVVAPVTS